MNAAFAALRDRPAGFLKGWLDMTGASEGASAPRALDEAK